MRQRTEMQKNGIVLTEHLDRSKGKKNNMEEEAERRKEEQMRERSYLVEFLL